MFQLQNLDWLKNLTNNPDFSDQKSFLKGEPTTFYHPSQNFATIHLNGLVI